MGRVLEFALTLFVVNLATSIFACLIGVEIGHQIMELFDVLLDALPD